MFAFGLWDQKNKKLIIARDRFGIKPLLYSYSENQFLFSSELKSIANHPKFDRVLDDNSIADYFTYSYVPFPNTVWKSAFKLPPEDIITRQVKRVVKYAQDQKDIRALEKRIEELKNVR